MKKITEIIGSLEIRNMWLGGRPIGIESLPDISIEGISYDSRSVGKNFVFVCVAGFRIDGNKFIADALQKGASVIVSQKKMDVADDVVFIEVDDSRAALSRLAACFYGYPDRQLRVIGVTGTAGKTTTTYMIKSILEHYGKKAGLIGTITYKVSDEALPSGRTTPESLDLESMFADALAAGVEYIVMEVSSHSLSLHRVDCIEFDQAVFTNLGLDHLDFHNTTEDYLRVKSSLFTQLDLFKEKDGKTAVVNIDDVHSSRILSSTSANKITYGLTKEADVYANPRQLDIDGISFEAFTPKGKMDVRLNIPGRFNIYNALAAIACTMAEGVPLQVIKEGLEDVGSIPGRFERIKGRDFDVIVDFAHTPESLKNLLETARQLTKKKLIVVFGCGGDRDRSKRPIMGEIAAGLSDYCILTSDNPRTEDPFRIILDIEAGAQKLKHRDEYFVAVDRKEAIERACSEAASGDLVVIAGKGHETYQILGEENIHFDDREIVKEVLKLEKEEN